MESTGFFTISIDFELYWGMRDVLALNDYEENIRNVHIVIPEILKLFTRYEIGATWCIVGFLFFDNKQSLLNNLPSKIPSYTDKNLNQYDYISKNDLEPIYHFAPEIIRLIKETKDQEIGSHTFSHYFCLEKGQQTEEFEFDIDKAVSILTQWGIDCKSIIFPRNQYDERYLTIAKNAGIKYYRGNEKYWIYQHRNMDSETKWKRFLRLTDAYLNLSGHNTFIVDKTDIDLPVNIPSSSFLRPHSPSLKFAENIRFKRISRAMTFAAKNKRGYHLWWHPHNFGKNINENLLFLERILVHYKKLNKEYGFTSRCMCEY